MKYGIYISNYALNGDPRLFVQLAKAAEESNWDGFFMWDHIYPDGGATKKVADPWITLSGIAASTNRIRIGTTVTPLPRRKPQKVAREVTSLDILSEGRFTLGVGLGHPPKEEFELFGEDPRLSARSGRLEESLEILQGLWSGNPFSFKGKYYNIQEVTFKPRPVQKPRVPIWCAGWWPRKGPFLRAAKFDGIFPLGEHRRLTPSDYRDIIQFVNTHRSSKKPLDVVMMGKSKGEPKSDSWINSYREEGVNWYVELIMSGTIRKNLERILKLK